MWLEKDGRRITTDNKVTTAQQPAFAQWSEQIFFMYVPTSSSLTSSALFPKRMKRKEAALLLLALTWAITTVLPSLLYPYQVCFRRVFFTISELPSNQVVLERWFRMPLLQSEKKVVSVSLLPKLIWRRNLATRTWDT